MPSFAELTDEFLESEFAESPVRASGLGLTEYDEQLDDLSEAAFERRTAADTAWLERFGAIGRGPLELRRGDRPRAGDQHPARPPDRRGLRGLAPAARRLPQPGHDRHLRPLPAPAAADGRAGRCRGGAHAPDPRQPRGRQAQPAARRWCPRSSSTAPRTRHGPGARYVRDILPAQMEDGALRAKLAEAGEAAGVGVRRVRRRSWRRCARRRPANGRSARSATRRCCARRSCSASAPASCASEGRQPTTSSPPS